MSWDDERLPEDLMHPPQREPDPFDGIPTTCRECGGETTYGTLAVFGWCAHCEQAERARRGTCGCAKNGCTILQCGCPCHDKK